MVISDAYAAIAKAAALSLCIDLGDTELNSRGSVLPPEFHPWHPSLLSSP